MGHRRPGGLWGGQQRDDRDRLLAVRAVSGRGRLQRVADRSGLPRGGANWRWWEFDPGRRHGWWRLIEPAGPLFIKGLVAAVLSCAAANHRAVDGADRLPGLEGVLADGAGAGLHVGRAAAGRGLALGRAELPLPAEVGGEFLAALRAEPLLGQGRAPLFPAGKGCPVTGVPLARSPVEVSRIRSEARTSMTLCERSGSVDRSLR